MKKSFLALASLAAIAVGCQVESMTDVPVVEGTVVYKAVTEAYAPATKTSMTAEKNVVWSANDEIAVFQGNIAYDLFQVTSASVGKTEAAFTLKEDREASDELPYNVAFYPVTKGMEAIDEDGVVSIWPVVLPATQKYAAGSFDNGAFPMVAVSEDNMFEFKNVLGAMKLQLKGDRTVKSITVTDNAGAPLAGEGTVRYSEGEDPEISFGYSGAANSVSLDCGEGVELNENTATEFVIALPATDFENGFTVIVNDVEGNVLKFHSKASDKNYIERSKVLVMPELDVEALTQDVHFKAVPSMTDITLDIKVNIEGANGFYGSVVDEFMWNMNIKPMIDYGQFNVNMLVSNQYAMGVAAACKYTTYSGSMVPFGWTDEYLSYDKYNMIAPNSKYYILVIPAFAEKDAALNQGGGEEDDLGGMPLMSLDEEDTPDVVGYTMDDVIIYEVSTLGFTTGGESTLTYTKEEGYSLSYVTVKPSADVIAAYTYIYAVGEELPGNDDYLDYYSEYDDTYYDPSMESFEVALDDFDMTPGSEWKIGVILVDAEGRASFHVIEARLLPIPVSSEDLTVTFGDVDYDPINGELFAEITEWPEDAELYFAFNNNVFLLEGDELLTAQADILEGPFNYKRVTDDMVDDKGVIYLSKKQSQYSSMEQTFGIHVIAVKDGKLGNDNYKKITVPKKQ